MNCPDTVKEDINRILVHRELFEELKGSTVLVTGATGQIGSMLVRVLTAENDQNASGIRVIGQIRNEEKAREIFGGLAERSDVRFICSDDFDLDVGCDYIIHTACPTASGFFTDHPVETIDTSLLGTRKMLALAARNDVRGMVYLSSMEEYGEPYTAGQRMTEEDCGRIDHLSIRSCYPESKRMCECYCACYASEYDVRVMIARLAQTFGAGVPLTDGRVFMQFAKSALDGTDIVLHTEGRSVSNFCYLSDAVQGILTILLKGNTGEAYNVCNDSEARSIREIAELVAGSVAEERIGVVVDIPPDSKFSYAPDTTMVLSARKLRDLGWTPETGMEEAYRRLALYLKEVSGSGTS